MTGDVATLSMAAISMGFVHCLCGPDHYVPFVAMSRIGLWSLRKTLLITFLCGLGHLAGSAALGFIGVALGIIVLQLEAAEEVRGNLAGWLLTLFGLIYFLWGLYYSSRRIRVSKAGSRSAVDAESAPADSTEDDAERIAAGSRAFTPWVLFVIFVFGPCEPLIPLLMYPAAKASVSSVVLVTVLFGVTTLVTMTALVALIYLGSTAIRFRRAEIYGHAIAGFVVLACGAAILLGL